MKNDSHALLRVSLPHGKSVQCQLQVGGQMLNAAGPPTAKLRPLEEDFERVFSSSRFEDVRKLVSLASTFAQTALPVVVAEALRQWASNHTEPVFLAVCCEAPQLVRLPWELIPLAWRAENLQVVRIPDHGKSVEPAAAKTTLAAHRLLAVGWPDLPNLKLPGIERELAQLPRQLQDPRLNVSILMGPTFSEFAKCYRDSDASILHLATPGIIHEAEQSYLVMAEPRDKKTGTPGSTPTRKAGSLPGTDLIEISEICQVLVEHSGLRLIVLNTCHGGLGVAGTLSRACGLATIGWAGFVADDLAADFALYFYQRLLEGKSAAESIYSFVHRFQVNEESVQACLPIVWLPTVESIGQRLLEPLESLQPPEFNVKVTENSAVRSNAFTDDFLRTTSVGKTPKPFDFSTGPIVVAPSGQACIPPSWPPPSESDECVQEPLQVQIDLEPALTISPALLKNGRPAIKRLSLLSNQPVAGLRLEVFCDAGFGTSVFRRVQSLKRGSQPIQDNIQFPVLFELSDRRWGRRRINFTARISDSSTILAEETRSALWMGHNEWMDREDTWPFIPSFVFPNSDAVREIFDQAVVELRKIGTPKDQFVGYQRKDADKVDLQMRAIFQTLRDQPLDYINPPAAPVYLSSEQGLRPSGQLVRFPEEVLQYKRGTCHDLALVVAACAEHIGVYALVVLCRGHTFCGYWRDPKDHELFWTHEQQLRASRASEFGDEWLIRDAEKLAELVQNGKVTLVEATLLTRDDTFETACRRFADVRKLRDMGLQAAIDVWQSRRNIQPL